MNQLLDYAKKIITSMHAQQGFLPVYTQKSLKLQENKMLPKQTRKIIQEEVN